MLRDKFLRIISISTDSNYVTFPRHNLNHSYRRHVCLTFIFCLLSNFHKPSSNGLLIYHHQT
jgi:hypothetical protein